MSRSRLYHQAFYNLLYASCFIFYNVLNPLRRRHSDTVLKHKFLSSIWRTRISFLLSMIDYACITDKKKSFSQTETIPLLDFDFHGLYFPMLHLKNNTLLLANSLNSLPWASC